MTIVVLVMFSFVDCTALAKESDGTGNKILLTSFHVCDIVVIVCVCACLLS